jgi:hypothetical protein
VLDALDCGVALSLGVAELDGFAFELVWLLMFPMLLELLGWLAV